MFEKQIASAEPAVVMIRCPDIGRKGSGFVVSRDGHIVTNNHVVAVPSLTNGAITFTYSKDIRVYLNGQEYGATLLIDPNDFKPVVFDYAILHVKAVASLPFLEVGEPDKLRRGEDVLCLGFPLDFEELIATQGIVSCVLRRPSHMSTLFQMQTIVSDAVIQFGNSGGPMLHAETGRAVGINTLSHELRDVLRQRLEVWAAHPASEDFSLIRDLTHYTLKYTYVGLNHAVSLRHAQEDGAWPR